MSSAGGLLLTETVRAGGLDTALSQALAPWRKPFAIHDPGKIVCDLAVSLALGGDCLADIAKLRAEPGMYGPVASDPTVSRLIDALACELTAWMQLLAYTGHQARRREPKRLRFRLFATAARLVRTGRRVLVRLPRLDRDRPTRQTTWPGEPSPDEPAETRITNREQDFAQFVNEDLSRRASAAAFLHGDIAQP